MQSQCDVYRMIYILYTDKFIDDYKYNYLDILNGITLKNGSVTQLQQHNISPDDMQPQFDFIVAHFLIQVRY